MGAFKDEMGNRYGRGVVIARAEKNKHGQTRWRLRCDCGNEYVTRGPALHSGRTKSCGCFNRERSAERSRTHGFSEHPLYKTYMGMVDRCYNPNNNNYHIWGGRGITVTPHWLGPGGLANFISDVEAEIGLRPDNPKGWANRNSYYSLNRIDNDGNYEPGNVEWANSKTQNNNKRHCPSCVCEIGAENHAA